MSTSISLNGNQVNISGRLTFANVPQLFNDCKQYIDHTDNLIFDFSGVISSDSAGLALVIEFLKYAKLKNKRISVRNLPDGMMSIAKASSLDGLLV